MSVSRNISYLECRERKDLEQSLDNACLGGENEFKIFSENLRTAKRYGSIKLLEENVKKNLLYRAVLSSSPMAHSMVREILLEGIEEINDRLKTDRIKKKAERRLDDVIEKALDLSMNSNANIQLFEEIEIWMEKKGTDKFNAILRID